MKNRLPLSLEGRDHRRTRVGKGYSREKEQHKQRHKDKKVDDGILLNLLNGWCATERGKS